LRAFREIMGLGNTPKHFGDKSLSLMAIGKRLKKW